MDDAAKSSAAETWRERIVAQQAGGQSIRALCKQNGWHEYAFYWWRSRLGLSPHPPAGRGRGRRRTAAAGFAEVVVGRPAIAQLAAGLRGSPVTSLAEPVCLRLFGGRELVLPVSMPLEQIAKLVGLIEGKPSTVEVSR